MIRILQDDGWYRVPAKGGHRQRAVKRGRVTVSGKMSHDLAPGTLNSILKRSGLKTED